MQKALSGTKRRTAPHARSAAASRHANIVDPTLPLFSRADRAETLYKLLRLGPETLDSLARISGWDFQQTQQAVLVLIADGRVLCRNLQGRRHYCAKAVARPIPVTRAQ